MSSTNATHVPATPLQADSQALSDDNATAATTRYLRRVDRGIDRLNAMHPGWLEWINPASLDLESSTRCILGQLYSDYHTGVEALQIDPDAAWQFGFHLTDDDDPAYGDEDLGDAFDALGDAWRERLTPLVATPQTSLAS